MKAALLSIHRCSELVRVDVRDLVERLINHLIEYGVDGEDKHSQISNVGS